MTRRISKIDPGESYITIPPDEVEYRMTLADMRSKETKVEADALKLARDKLEFEIKKSAICRIDAALAAFDAYVLVIVDWISGLPDLAQTLVPALTPAQYKLFQEEAERQIQRMAETRIRLSLEPLEAQRAEVREADTTRKRESRARKSKAEKTGEE